MGQELSQGNKALRTLPDLVDGKLGRSTLQVYAQTGRTSHLVRPVFATYIQYSKVPVFAVLEACLYNAAFAAYAYCS